MPRRNLDRARFAALSTPANPPRRVWTKTSIPSTPSVKRPRPISRAKHAPAGSACPSATTMAASLAAISTDPPLQRLLADLVDGQVDCVLVYKVDRLSRSLLDFAKIMETFEAHQVAFVSVTQMFSTATSMGRLVLNVLLSFAQFER